MIRIEPGAPPWLPSADAKPVVEYRYYDVPFEGIVDEYGVEFLFECLDGSEGASCWLYSRTTPEERADIESSGRVGEYEARMGRRRISPPIALAVAFENVGIVAYRVIDDSEPETLREALASLKHEISTLAREVDDFDLEVVGHR